MRDSHLLTKCNNNTEYFFDSYDASILLVDSFPDDAVSLF